MRRQLSACSIGKNKPDTKADYLWLAVSALLLALIAGWMVPAPRLAMAAFLGPWLVALIYQTTDIGLGYAVSPPQTVTQFPRVIGYVVVTAVILALGLILAALIGERRSRVVPDDARRTAREMVTRATAAGTVVVAALIVLDIADHAILVWPESTAHHTTNPSPPLFGNTVHRAVPDRHCRPGDGGAAAPGRCTAR